MTSAPADSSDSSSIDLSIIIPAYMEAAGIGETLDRLAAFLRHRHFGVVEVVVVVADSPDGTAKIVRSKTKLFKHLRLIEPGPRVGKGRDVRSGMLAAKGRYKLFMDADLATPLQHIDDVHNLMATNPDIIIAVRDLWSIHEGYLRKIMSAFGNLLIQALILPGIKDTQCGFKAFRADVADAVFSRQTILGWSFDAEILKIGNVLNYRIIQIEADDWHDPKPANMGLVGDSPLHAAIQTLLDTVKIRVQAWKGYYRKSHNINGALR